MVSQAARAAGDDDCFAEDGHVAHCVGELLVDIAGERVDGLGFGAGWGCVVVDARGRGDVDGVFVGGAVAGVVVCNGDFLFGDAVLLVGGLEAVGPCGGEVVNWYAGDCRVQCVVCTLWRGEERRVRIGGLGI